MYWLVGLLVLQLALEGVTCSEGHRLPVLLRRVAVVAAIVSLAAVTVVLCVANWHVWIWTVPVVGYRVINLLRVYLARLPAQHLRTVSLRAFYWLVLAQTAVTGGVWLVLRNDWDGQVFAGLVVVQLLAAVILLRSTLHTWRHAGAPNDRTVAISDRELPSVSVLVPARNETDDLERCLQALTASDYPKLEVLVYDDCSATRRTPDIIRSFAHQGVRFIQGDVPDETRWLAKNYSYSRLAAIYCCFVVWMPGWNHKASANWCGCCSSVAKIC
jgi:hypothetical protein